jgi:hypothetical protein
MALTGALNLITHAIVVYVVFIIHVFNSVCSGHYYFWVLIRDVSDTGFHNNEGVEHT